MSSLLVNLLDVLVQILAIYEFLEAITVILAMFEPTPTLPIFILVNFSYELRQIMTRYAFLEVR